MFRKEGIRKTEKKEQQFKTMRKFEIQKRKKKKIKKKRVSILKS